MSSGHPVLLRRIAEEIRAQGPIPFARFMDLALHDPEHGYYAAGGSRLGPAGDFFTASDLGPAFGTCLARQLADVDAILGAPAPFRLVELAAGRGILARDVAAALSRDAPELERRLEITLVDASPGMRAAAQGLLPTARVVPPGGAGEGGAGLVVAVELFDALPVHRLRRRDGRLVEIRVGLDGAGSLVEVEGDPVPEAAAWAERYGAAREEGSEAEACPLLDAEVARMARLVDPGVFVIVDYGHESEELYAERHARGTLLAYSRHRTREEYLERVGEQDLTAHVNFSALRDAGERAGLRWLGATTQDRFLIANGILEVFEAEDAVSWRDPARVRERTRAMRLIHPDGMGRMFRVAILAKGLPEGIALRGLEDPFRR